MRLERILGPGTGDLRMRFGLHSGPVTAGVLRGSRARFQLFGDTMNTASRIEETGLPGRIHVSERTATLLMSASKGHWVEKREDKVIAKGKGELSTFWIKSVRDSSNSQPDSSVQSSTEADGIWAGAALLVDGKGDSEDTQERLIIWNVEMLKGLLLRVVASRLRRGKKKNKAGTTGSRDVLSNKEAASSENHGMVLDEVREIIMLPNFDSKLQGHDDVALQGELSREVETELYDFVQAIADNYHKNPFHNFEHASHVAMSVNKLLSRIVAPDLDDMLLGDGKKGTRSFASDLHDHTYGITSDPLTHFSCAFASLIHDVDHRGVSNKRLAEEDQVLAARYENKSIAEQRSVDLAWKLLESDKYSNLRGCIYSNEDEKQRFRQIVVNSVSNLLFNAQLAFLRSLPIVILLS